MESDKWNPLCLLDAGGFFLYNEFITKEKTMTDQTDSLIAEVQSKNKAENYHKENTDKLYILQDIWQDTDKLDNISEHLMRKFNQILSR